MYRKQQSWFFKRDLFRKTKVQSGEANKLKLAKYCDSIVFGHKLTLASIVLVYFFSMVIKANTSKVL